MTEVGWPLIPREVLPAPVPAAKRRLPPRVVVPEGGRQLPFFGAETTEPAPADLVGLLAGPGRLGRMGGTARVSVEVDAAWRVHVLVAELVARGLVTHWRPLADDSDGRGQELQGSAPLQEESDGDEISEEGAEDPPKPRFEVLTAYSSRLVGLARAWPEVSEQLFLSGPRLRLWVAAAGAPVPGGYALGLGPAKDLAATDAALVRAGLAGRPSEDGCRYRIMGRRRVRRLAELVGERPGAAPADAWPFAASA